MLDLMLTVLQSALTPLLNGVERRFGAAAQ